jgi:hypothetical protein
MTNVISQIKHIYHTVNTNQQDHDFDKVINKTFDEIYPAAELGVTWCFVEVVVPLDAVPIESCEEVATKKTITSAPGNKEERRRVVVPPTALSKNRDGRPSPKQVNSLDGDVLEALLFHLVCAQETERKNSFAAGYVVCSSRSTEGLSSLYIRGRSRETSAPPERRRVGRGERKGQQKLL